MSVGVGVFDATVVDLKLTRSGSGTRGVWVKFAVGGDHISETRWISPKTKQRVEKDLLTIGATKEMLRDPAFWKVPMEYLPANPQVSIVTEEEEGTNGHKPRVRVKWINSVVAAATKEDVEDVIAMFGEVSDDDPFAGVPPNTDDPFS